MTKTTFFILLSLTLIPTLVGIYNIITPKELARVIKYSDRW